MKPAAPDRLRAAGAALALLLLFALHAGVDMAWVHRIPAQEKTFHDHDLRLLRHPLILRGQYWAPQLPADELVPPTWPGKGPYDLFAGALRNEGDGLRSYRTLAPLGSLVSALPATLLGLSLQTVRLGPLALLALLLVAAFDTGRWLGRGPDDDGLRAGLFAAFALGMLPLTWLGTLVGVPTLGNMAGVLLALWALLRSDGLSKPGFSALAGVMMALSARWGESVGDGLACLLALAGPAGVVLALALNRLLARKDPWPLLGAPAAAALFLCVLDRPWLENHLRGYILDQANVGGSAAAPLLPRLASNLGDYHQALLWSLLGPAGLALVGLGLLLGFSRLRRQPALLVLMASPVSGLLALSLSAKGNDYYAAPVVPGLVLAAAVGLALLPRRGWMLGLPLLGWSGLSWLVTAHLDTAALSSLACRRPVRVWIAGDPTRCDPAGGKEEAIYQWFRQWRRKPGRERQGRRAIGDWLMVGDGRRWLEGLGPGSLVILQVPPGPGGGADVVQLIGQSERPDTLFHRVEGGMADARSEALVAWARAEGRPLQLLTFAPYMHTGSGDIQRPTGWLGPLRPGPGSDLVSTWTLD